MTTEDYEQKRRECWEALHNELLKGEVQWQPVSRKEIFSYVFDRAYALGKETKTVTQEDIEKAWQDYAEEIGLPESLNYATRPMIEIAIRQAFKSGANFSLGKQEKDAEETVIQGWVARDEEVGNIWLFQNKPTRNTDLSYGFWDGNNDDFIDLPITSFPDLTWESDPLPVEIILKRKKK